MTRAFRPIGLALLALCLTACNRSAGGAPPADLAWTSVAATLTAAPSLPEGAMTSPDGIPFPTRTPPPSATPIISPSPTATPTPTIGPTPSASPPPLPPGDPRTGLNLSMPDYRDDFANRLTWIGPSFAGATNEVENGRLHSVDRLADSFIWWSTTVPDANAANVYVEVTAEIGACAGKDGYGLAVRVAGAAFNSGCTLEFSCDGAYRIRRFSGGSVDTLVDWTTAEAIRTGPNMTNRMGLLARSQTLHAFANGLALGQVEGVSYEAGTYGLFASAQQTTDLSVYFDDFALWYLGP
jgi:hypothetical protein